uniref:Uncharacterized protein n=1 Tax=Arion vulgaris TaxID=1028688 RepID=A0A0B7AUM8_9EUPU
MIPVQSSPEEFFHIKGSSNVMFISDVLQKHVFQSFPHVDQGTVLCMDAKK